MTLSLVPTLAWRHLSLGGQLWADFELTQQSLHDRVQKRWSVLEVAAAPEALEMQPWAAGGSPLHTRRGPGLREFNKFLQTKLDEMFCIQCP